MKLFNIILLLLLSISTAYASKKQSTQPYVNYINLPVTVSANKVINTAAQLRIPKNITTPAPAVIILHTTIGVDSTGSFYASKLNKKGIITLELDMWGSRGLTGGAADRPAAPQETLADAYTALAYLAQHPKVDADKIGLLGFSWGAVVTMLTATNQYDALSNLPYKFAAHVAHYPICYGYNQIPGFEFSNLTGAPVLIQAAELDEYDYPGACEDMVSQIPAADQQYVEVIEYPNVYHTWDRLEPELIVEDPIAHLGQGGLVTLKGHKRIAKKSRKKAIKFFEQAFNN